MNRTKLQLTIVELRKKLSNVTIMNDMGASKEAIDNELYKITVQIDELRTEVTDDSVSLCEV